MKDRDVTTTEYKNPDGTYAFEMLMQRGSNVLHVDVWYPRNNPTGDAHVQMGLVDVRAADDISVRYDFDRDGWAISQQVYVERDGFSEETGEWREVAFIAAWGLEQKGEDD